MSASPEPDEFDPYRIWLGIPKSEQPPTYYRLLGVSEFETDPLVIQEGADRQSAHLRSKQIGQRQAASQKLLAEVAAAMGCLLNAENKAKYDRQLRARQQAELAAAEAFSTPVIEASFPVARAIPVSPAVPLPPPPVFEQPEPPAPYYEPPQQPVIHTSPATRTKKPKPSEGKLDPQTLKLIGLGVAAITALFSFVLVSGVIYWLSHKPEPPPLVQRPEPPVVQPSPAENPFEQNVKPADPIRKSTPTQPSTNVVASPNPPNPIKPIIPPVIHQRPRPASLIPPDRAVVNHEALHVPSAATMDGVEYLRILFAHLEQSYLNAWNVQAAEQHSRLYRDALANPSPPAMGSIPADPSQLAGYKERLLDAAWRLDRRAQVDQETAKQVFPEVPARLLVMLCVSPREAASQPQGEVVRINGRDEFDERLTRFITQLSGHAQAFQENRELHDRLLHLTAIARAIQYAYKRGYVEQLIACQLLELQVRELSEFSPQPLTRDLLRNATDDVLQGAGLATTGENVNNDPRKQFTDESVRPLSTYLWQAKGRWVQVFANSSKAYLETQRTRTTIVLQPVEQPGQTVTLTLDWRHIGESSGGQGFTQPGFRHGQWEVARSDRGVIGHIRPRFPDQGSNTLTQFTALTNHPLLTAPATSTATSPATTTNGTSVPPDANTRYLPPIGESRPGRTVATARQLTPGSRVHIYRGTWFTGEVLGIEDNLIRVHYDNQNSSYDEAVVTRRVRIMTGPDGNPLVATNPLVQPPPGTVTSGSPSTSSNSSLPMSVNNPDSKRRLWSHAAGYVAMNSDGTWNELTPAGNYYTLALKSVTDEYLELQREGRAGSIRLFQKHMEVSPRSYNNFAPGPKGGWITPLEEIEIDPAKQAALKKTVDQYAEALTKAREALLERFQSAITNNFNRVGRAEERLAYISVLEAEQERFKMHGLVPFSQPMRQAAVDYISTINRARFAAEPTFNKAMEYFISNQQMETAYAVRVLRQRTLAPVLLVKLVRMDAGRPSQIAIGAGAMTQEDRQVLLGEDAPVAVRLWSGGALIHDAGDARWSADNTGLSLTSPREKNVTVKDKLTFNDHGNEFTATTQQLPGRGQPQKYNGGVLNTLETYERRPVISFEPKTPAAELAPAADETPMESSK